MTRHDCLFSVLLALAASVHLSAVHAQPAAPAQAAPDYSSASGVIPWSAIMEKSSTGAADSGSARAPGTQSTDAVKGDVKPIHEELSRSNLKEAIREFNADEAGAKKPAGEGPAPGATVLRNPLSPAAKAAQAQANEAEWASLRESGGLMAEILPWAVAFSVALVLGLAAKMWLGYMRAKAARPGKRRRAARKRNTRSLRASLDSPAPPAPPDSVDSVDSPNSSNSLLPGSSSANLQEHASTSTRSAAPGASSRQRKRHRLPRI